MSTEPTDAQPVAGLAAADTWLATATHILDTAAQHFGLEQDRSELLEAFNALSGLTWTLKDAQQGPPAPASQDDPTDAEPVAWLLIHAGIKAPILSRSPPSLDQMIKGTFVSGTPLYAHPPAPHLAVMQQDGTLKPVESVDSADLAGQVRVLREALALLERHVALSFFDQWDVDRNGNWLNKGKSPVLSSLLAGAQDALAATAPDAGAGE